jgi:preprotein translocase subunit YajC
MAPTLLYVAQGDGGGLLGMLLPMVLVFGIFYFLVIRPQGKQRQEREKMLSLLKRDDQVITVGGVFGKIRSIHDGVATLEIADRINIRIRLSSIEGKVPDPAASKDASKDSTSNTEIASAGAKKSED